MNIRRAAIIQGEKHYEGRCAKNPDHRYRWTGSGACIDCYPRRRGTLVTAMTALYGAGEGVTLEYAQARGLPLFRAVCTAQGHNSWRYVKTPHICLQCVAMRRRKRKPRPAVTRERPTIKPWYFVADLRSGLVVSYIGHSNAAAAQIRRDIKREHPGMLPIVMARKPTTRAAREIAAKGMLRLDQHPWVPDWPLNDSK